MKDEIKQNEIWFVYDGECPLCKTAALALEIKKEYGTLNLLNAHDNVEHDLVQEINKLGLDLDEGMIIFDGEHYHHGKDALQFMARFGDTKGIFNLANKALFWSDCIANITYPWMRGVRNVLLRKKKVDLIDNLNLNSGPTFKAIFGNKWEELPPVMQKHYMNRPYTKDVTTVEGTLDVRCSGPIKMFAWVFWLMRGIPPHTEKNVPVTVHFESDLNSKYFHFNRIFYFKNRKPYRFQSRMLQIKSNEVIEIMQFRLGWRMNYILDEGNVKLKHRGYALSAFGHFIPLPINFLLGKGDAEEIAIDDNTFDMSVCITHPLWGEIYGYKGQFKVKEST